MTLTRRARRTVAMAVPATAAVAAFSGLAVAGVLGPHHDTSSPTQRVTSTPSVRPQPTKAPSPSPSSLNLRSVNWKEVALPGETCLSDAPIRLHGGRAVVPATPRNREVMLNLLFNPAAVVYGPVEGNGSTDAALLVYCANQGSNASGDIRNTLVVFSGRGGKLHVLGVLYPGVQTSGELPTLMAPPTITAHQLTVAESFYGPADSTASPSGRATTVFTWTGKTFLSHTTISAQPTPAATQPTVSTNPPAPADLDLRRVNWNEVALPGGTCFSNSPIQLHGGQAELPTTPYHHTLELQQIWNPSGIVYGPLTSSTPVAAVLSDCGNTGGAGGSNLRDAITVFSGTGGTLHVLGTLLAVNQQRPAYTTMIKDVVVSNDTITFTEYLFSKYDAPPFPSGRATTVYTWNGSSFSVRSTITQPTSTGPTRHDS